MEEKKIKCGKVYWVDIIANKEVWLYGFSFDFDSENQIKRFLKNIDILTNYSFKRFELLVNLQKRNHLNVICRFPEPITGLVMLNDIRQYYRNYIEVRMKLNDDLRRIELDNKRFFSYIVGFFDEVSIGRIFSQKTEIKQGVKQTYTKIAIAFNDLNKLKKAVYVFLNNKETFDELLKLKGVVLND